MAVISSDAPAVAVNFREREELAEFRTDNLRDGAFFLSNIAEQSAHARRVSANLGKCL